MKKRHIYNLTLVVIGCGVLLWSLRDIQIPYTERSRFFWRVSMDGRQVFGGAALYSLDNDDRFPKTLEELVPNYLPHNKWIAGFHLLTPGSRRADLSRETAILKKEATDPIGGLTRWVIIQNDGKVRLERP